MDDLIAWIESLNPWEILGYSLVAAFVLQLVITRVLPLLTGHTKTQVDDQVLSALRWPVFLTLLFIGVSFAVKHVDFLGVAPAPDDASENVKEAVAAEKADADRYIGIIVSVLVTIGTWVWMRASMRISDAILDAMARRADDFNWIQPRSLPLFEIVAKLLVVGGAIYVIMLAWGINVTAWLASAGILGIAIGFAAKDTLANLFAGIFILTDAPYKLGDYIITGAGERGVVTDIGIRSTRIRTRDDIEITIPNGVMANTKIVNETGGRFVMRRLRVPVGVAYGSDLDKVREVLLEVADQSQYLVADPAPSVRVRGFGDSAIDLQLRGWIPEPELKGRALDEVNMMLYKRFAEEGIEIPFPQRVVHMQQA